MKLLITGAGGLLGSTLETIAPSEGHDVVAVARADLDITDADRVDSVVATVAPDVIVNCAAFTNVDGAESSPELAMAVNRDGVANLAEASTRAGARLVHISTDYVFSGPRSEPFRPTDPPAPESVYAATKLAGEREALTRCEDGLVVRVSWLYGAGRPNFMTWVLGQAEATEPLRIVDDQVSRPTWVENAATVLLELIEREAIGVYHLADGGQTTKAGLAREAFRQRGIETEVLSITSDDWGAPARRPSYSVLDLTETEQLVGREMMDWRVALGRFLARSEA